MPGVKPQFDISDDGTSATVGLMRTAGAWSRYSYLHQSTLKIYGPALQKLELGDNTYSSYSTNGKQEELEVTAKAARFELAGAFDRVFVIDTASARVDLEPATIGDLTVNNKGGRVDAGVVRRLTVMQPEACPVVRGEAYDTRATVHVQAISSGEIAYNGTKRSAQTISSECGVVQVGDTDDNEREEN